MSNKEPAILVTGASGQLGRLVVSALLKSVPADRVRVLVRTPASVSDFAAVGVDVRAGDYDHPATLDAAFAGVGRALLISSSEVGKRVTQHGNVIEAAKRAGVALLAYTSILRADTSPLGLAAEHLVTEVALHASGVPFALLRNGWYFENNLAAIPAMLAHGASLGASGSGKISAAARADFALAAVAVLTAAQDPSGQVYELAGDVGYSKAEVAAEVARQSGTAIVYENLPEAEFAAALEGIGLPKEVAALVADSDAGAADGWLFDGGGALAKLIGRPTTTLEAAVAAALVPAEAHA